MSRPLVYDLFCGHGGVGLALDELDVRFVGVDIEDRSATYPGEFVRADASRPPLAADADLVWASPPCLAYSKMSYMNYEDPREVYPTIPELGVREIADELGSEYVIENVPLCEDLRDPTRADGLAFGKPYRIERHFETSFPAPDALGKGPAGITISTAGGKAYDTPELADAKRIPRDWGEPAINAAIPREYVHWILSFCPTVDAPRPAREQTMLTEVAR